MQLKRFPGDFRVFEVVDLPADAGTSGEFFVHRLRKEKLDTLEAIGIVARHAGVERADIAFAGLKDRQGVTEQYISIRGKRVEIDDQDLQVRFVSRAMQPITSKISRGNAFEIIVRDLDKRDSEYLRERVAAIARGGFPNYFDDQRFQCLRHGQGFVMKAVLLGEYDRALEQWIGRPSRLAKGGDVKLKSLLQENWGDWERCLRTVRGPIYRRVFEILVRDPSDFHGALASMPSREKLIHAYAFQSHLWNRAVSRHFEDLLPTGKRTSIETEAGEYVGWFDIEDELRDQIRAASMPLYGPEGDGGTPEFRAAMQRTLKEVHLTADSFRVHEVPGMILRQEPRAALVVPTSFGRLALDHDETNRGRLKARLEFELPRGSYATMLLKCMWAPAWRARRATSERRPPRQDDRGGYQDRSRSAGRNHGGDRPRGEDRPYDGPRRDADSGSRGGGYARRDDRSGYGQNRSDRPGSERARDDRPRVDRPRDDRPRHDGPRDERQRSDRPRFDRPRSDGPRDDRRQDRSPSHRPGEYRRYEGRGDDRDDRARGRPDVGAARPDRTRPAARPDDRGRANASRSPRPREDRDGETDRRAPHRSNEPFDSGDDGFEDIP